MLDLVHNCEAATPSLKTDSLLHVDILFLSEVFLSSQRAFESSPACVL